MTKHSNQEFGEICVSKATHDSIMKGELLSASAQNLTPRATTETDAELAALVSGWNEEPMDDTTGFDRSLQFIFENSSENSVEIDTEKYVAMLDDPALTEAQKVSLIAALSEIIEAFVDLGFGVHPAQLAEAENNGGKASESLDQSGSKDSNEFNSLEKS